jgi:hypothetical protein
MSYFFKNISPSGTPDQDWDPEAALARVAHGDVAALAGRLHTAAEAYAGFPESHLTFEEIQQVTSGDTQALATHTEHLDACEFCSGLRETLATPEAAKQAFAELVKGYERSPEKRTLAERKSIRSDDKSTWQPRRGHLAWQGFGLAAVLVIGIGLGSYYTDYTVRAKMNEGLDLAELPISSSKFIVKPTAHWDTVRASCARQTGQQQSCDLFADAAQLQIDGKTQTARPVVVDALKKSGASSAVLSHVDRTLATPTDPDPSARERAVNEARVVLAKGNGSNPDQLLQLAKLQFEGGQPVAGYEYLKAYVAADNPNAGQALQIAFVEPVTFMHLKRAGSPPTSSKEALDSQAVAAAAAAGQPKDANN